MLPEIWLRALGDLTVEKFERACEAHLQQSKFFPTVADIRQIAEEQVTEPRLDQTPTGRKLFARYKKQNEEEEKRRLAGTDGPALDGKPKLH
jgi:hypothetical protein